MTKRDKVMRGSLRNERTGRSVASVAGKVLERIRDIRRYPHIGEMVNGSNPVHIVGIPICSIDELESVLASALTQSPDRIVHATARPKKAGRVGRK